MQCRAENRFAFLVDTVRFKPAGKAADQIAWQHLAFTAAPIAGFHRVLDQHADFDYLAAFGGGLDSDERARQKLNLSLFNARGERDQHLNRMRPATAVAHFGNCQQFLRGGQPNARGDMRTARTWAQRKFRDIALRIFFIEYRNANDMIQRCHRAFSCSKGFGVSSPQKNHSLCCC